MTIPPNWSQTGFVNNWPAVLPDFALAGVRKRRIVALWIDLFLISLICFSLWLFLGLLSFGLMWLVLPPLYPIIAFLYNGLSIAGRAQATPGQRAMDLQVQLRNGMPSPFLNAAVHSLLFYLSWMFPPIFIISFLDSDKRCLHDIIAGLVFTRRGA
jgi:uncharacterized RDD family membrane protein YckC